jgi:hypothetical protein
MAEFVACTEMQHLLSAPHAHKAGIQITINRILAHDISFDLSRYQYAISIANSALSVENSGTPFASTPLPGEANPEGFARRWMSYSSLLAKGTPCRRHLKNLR